MANLRPRGRLVIHAIRTEDSDKHSLPDICYHDHLWMEKEIKSVAKITHHDIRDFLPLATEIPLNAEVITCPFEDANRALAELKRGGIRVAKELQIQSAD